MRALAELVVQLQDDLTLDGMLSLVVSAGSNAIGCPHTSLRLFDATRERLLVTARAGRSIHARGDVSFAVGEGLVGWVAQHTKPLRTGDVPNDPRYVERADVTVPFRSFLGVPLVADRQCIGVLSAARADPDAFRAEDEDVFVVLAALAAPRLEVARLRRLAGVDPLTGALNRRGLQETLAPADLAPPLGVAIVDVDHFKAVNDRHGHTVGDEVLRHIARHLGSVIRATDVLVRWGGEEFVIVLPGASGEQARIIAERARSNVASSRITTSNGDVPVTISVGLASMRTQETWTDVVERADAALYRAKRGGRDRVIVDDDAA